MFFKPLAKLSLLLCLPFLGFGQEQEVITFKKYDTPFEQFDEFNAKKRDVELLIEHIDKMKALVTLDLTATRASYWDFPSDTQFPDIQNLSLVRNQLVTFPKWVCNITSLKELSLGNNEIVSIPECICELTQLEKLDLWGNNIYRLPDCMYRMPKIREVDMTAMQYNIEEQENFIQSFPNINFKFSDPCDCEFQAPPAVEE